MDASTFPGDLKPFNELDPNQRAFLIEHYRRCEAFWRHWTPTIWSIPSVAAAINIGAYGLLFGVATEVAFTIKTGVLLILAGLNIALTVGLWKHRYMQRMFGQRIVAIERYAQIPTIELSTLQRRVSGSFLYLVLMAGTSLINLVLLTYKLVVRSQAAF